MYRIILIDDEPLILAGIASLICWEEHDCCIVGKATNGHDAIDMILETQPDIIITDIRMPVMNGLELIEACQEKHCEFAFIFLTNLEDFQLAKQAVRLGAIDYLVKLDLQPQTLIQALDRAKEHCSRMESHHNKELYSLLLKDTQEQQERNYFSQLILSPADHELPSNPEISDRYQDACLILLQMKPEQILFGHTEAYDFQFISSQLQDIVSGIALFFQPHHTDAAQGHPAPCRLSEAGKQYGEIPLGILHEGQRGSQHLFRPDCPVRHQSEKGRHIHASRGSPRSAVRPEPLLL